jgi:hypothetical protein
MPLLVLTACTRVSGPDDTADTSSPATDTSSAEDATTSDSGDPADTTPETSATDVDDSSRDPTAVTIAALVGAALLIIVAIVWMLRVGRRDDPSPITRAEPANDPASDP